MENNNLYVYFVEGQDEKKLVEILKTELNVIYPGKVYVFNVTTEVITRARLMQIKPGTVRKLLRHIVILSYKRR